MTATRAAATAQPKIAENIPSPDHPGALTFSPNLRTYPYIMNETLTASSVRINHCMQTIHTTTISPSPETVGGHRRDTHHCLECGAEHPSHMMIAKLTGKVATSPANEHPNHGAPMQWPFLHASYRLWAGSQLRENRWIQDPILIHDCSNKKWYCLISGSLSRIFIWGSASASPEGWDKSGQHPSVYFEDIPTSYRKRHLCCLLIFTS